VRLPDQPRLRQEAYVELSRQCTTDRSERKSYHSDLRVYYTTGTAIGARARYNKLKAHIQQSAAYLYQSESVRFAAVLPPQYGEHFTHQLEAFRDEIHRWWHDSRAGLTVATGVRWGTSIPRSCSRWCPRRASRTSAWCLILATSGSSSRTVPSTGKRRRSITTG